MRLEMNGLNFGYGNRPVLRNINLQAAAGEICSIVGPNGSGKTTLLKCVNRILKPTSGRIAVDGTDINRFKSRELATIFGYVPQSAPGSFPLTVVDAVSLGRTPYIHYKMREKDRETVFRAISVLGLEQLAFRMLNELSGGERQRVLIARALVQEPKVILLDEPTSSLDLKHQLETLAIIRGIARERKIAVLMTIHDLNLAARFSEKTALLKEGRIVKAGPLAETLTADSIREVYGVEAVIAAVCGQPVIVPLSAADSLDKNIIGNQ